MIRIKYEWICFYLLLTTILVILKATQVINWSWWLIMLPLYLPVIATIAFLIIAGIVVYRNTK